MQWLQHHELESFDGRRLNVLASARLAGLPDIVLVLPFGTRHDIADGLYLALAGRCNLVTWESRFVLDPCRDLPGAEIGAVQHAADMERVVSATHGSGSGGVGALGYCSGAGVAMLAASMFPSCINRLALVAGEYALPAPAARRTSFQNEVATLLPLAAAGIDDAGRLVEKIAAASRGARGEFHEQVSIPFSNAEHLHRFGLNYVAYERVDFRRLARGIAQPTLLVSTGEDRQVTREGAMLIAAELPRAVELELPAGDHYALCRGEKALVDVVMTFLCADEMADCPPC